MERGINKIKLQLNTFSKVLDGRIKTVVDFAWLIVLEKDRYNYYFLHKRAKEQAYAR